MSSPKPNNKRLAVNMALIALGMLMLAYASVPLYRLFCQVTGFGGTPVLQATLPDTVVDRVMTIRFNADVDKDLPWKFEAGQVSTQVKVGEEILSYYIAENMSDKHSTGHATYNVVPHKAGPYFAKVACFCFENQTLEPGQKVNMPISFLLTQLLWMTRKWMMLRRLPYLIRFSLKKNNELVDYLLFSLIKQRLNFKPSVAYV